MQQAGKTYEKRLYDVLATPSIMIPARATTKPPLSPLERNPGLVREVSESVDDFNAEAQRAEGVRCEDFISSRTLTPHTLTPSHLCLKTVSHHHS